MKTYLFILISLLYQSILLANNPSDNNATYKYLQSTLSPTYPKEMEPTVKLFNFTAITSTQLITGFDSIKVYVGVCKQMDQSLFWCNVIIDGICNNFTAFAPKQKNENILFEKKHVLVFANDKQSVTLQFQYNKTTNQLYYCWLNGNQKSNTATINRVVKAYDIGQSLPPLKLKTLDDKTIDLHDYLGKTLVINWWATTCGPCKKEMPGLNILIDSFAKYPNIVFIAIADNTKEEVQSMLANTTFNYVQTLTNKKAKKLFGRSYPTHLVVDTKGVITLSINGGSENIYKSIENHLQKIVQ